MFKKTLLIFLSLASVSLPSYSFASEAVHKVSTRRARGIEKKVVEVKVYPFKTGATILNFRPTSEKVRQVSVVGSALLMSSDDPACLSSNAGRSSGEICSATLLYLQQKPEESVPVSERITKTRMSVITDQNIYLFDVVLAKGEPEYSVVEVYPQNQNSSSEVVSINDITVLLSGFKVAVAEGYVNNPEFNRRLRLFLDLIRTEKTLESAAKKAGISMEAVSKLRELGLQKNMTK